LSPAGRFHSLGSVRTDGPEMGARSHVGCWSMIGERTGSARTVAVRPAGADAAEWCQRAGEAA